MKPPFTNIVAIDYETKWASKPTSWSDAPFTLSKLTNEEYVRSPLFKDFGACVQRLDPDLEGPRPQWYTGGDELRRVLHTYDWSKTAVLAHNAQFDISIMSWHYGIQPAFIFDTLSMARALRGIEVGNSLMKLAEDFGLPPKGRAVHSTDGLEELTPEIEKELADYCQHDVFLLVEIFKRLLPGYPVSELKLIDMTLKMYTRPLLRLDEDMLHKAINEERVTREGLLERLGVTDGMLASNDQFAQLLSSMGVEPPQKVSKTTGKKTWALAKNDALFQALLNGENEDVALLCEARLKVKSTTERTRAQRFVEIAERGTLPVPLSYYGAATGRWTAAKGSAINMQNLKRGSFLRKAIMAPEGQVLVVGDLSQIEPRVLGWLADYDELLDIFRSGEDAYAMFGRQMFNMPDLNKKDHPDLRQSAKSALLGCGYSLGWASFASQLLVGFLGAPPVRYDKAFAKKLGVTADYVERFLAWDDNVQKMQDIPHTCSTKELIIHCVAAKKIIDIYRATAYPVVGFWNLCEGLIQRSLADGEEYNHKGCLLFRKEAIVLANGMTLKYPNLRQQKDERGRPQWVYGPDATNLYAGKITNNVTQATARIVMTDGMLRVGRKYPILMTVHDEFCIMCPEAEAEEATAFVYGEMTRVPKWMPGIPLESEVGYSQRYGDAK
jgi:hypothetical protein